MEETRAFFAELLHGDLPASNLVDSDFAMLNERLARHYGNESSLAIAHGDAATNTTNERNVTAATIT